MREAHAGIIIHFIDFDKCFWYSFFYMAHTKAKGSTKLGRDSRGQRLGIKIFGGQAIKTGQIIARQRGSKWYAGQGVSQGKDNTLFAIHDGVVKFYSKSVRNFDGNRRKKTFVAVEVA